MDTSVFTKEEHEALTEEDIETLISKKFNTWKNYINIPAHIPTISEMQSLIIKLEKEVIDTQKQITVLKNKVK